MSEKPRDPPVAGGKSNPPDGFYRLEWRDSVADSQMQGQRVKGCMHDQFTLFQGDSQDEEDVDSGSLRWCVDSGGVMRGVKS